MKPGERLAPLEGLRGHTAMLVFLTHAFGMLIAKLYGVADAEHLYVLDGGSAGVAGMRSPSAGTSPRAADPRPARRW